MWHCEPEPNWTEAGLHWRSNLAGWYKESNTEQGKKGLHVARCGVSEPSGERDVHRRQDHSGDGKLLTV